jgi:hypothetical protein
MERHNVTTNREISGELLHFLDSHVDSIGQLEILRILGECPEREWSASNLARLTHSQSSVLAADLLALEGRGLLKTQKQGSELLCRYEPRTPELGQPLRQLLQLYGERPVTLIKMLYSRDHSESTTGNGA